MLPQNDKEFVEFIYKQLESLQKSSDSDDKSLAKLMLLVSTGAFGLSITFFISQSELIKNPNILMISWLCLALSIFSNARGYFLSRKAKSQNVRYLNQKISSYGSIFSPTEYNKFQDEIGKSRESEDIDNLNEISFYLFTLGLFSLTVFAIIQLY